MLTWKIVGASKASVLYIYIDDTTGRKMRLFFLSKLLIVKNNTLLSKLLQLIKSLLGNKKFVGFK